MIKKCLIVASFFCFNYFPTLIIASPTIWQTLEPGLDYTTTSVSHNADVPGKLHAFKIDLKNYSLHLVTADQLNKESASVKALNNSIDGLIAINGGFFSPNRKILGLRTENGKIINPVRPISWWSVFYVKHNKAYLVRANKYYHNRHVDFALQAGPRLVINGRIPALKPGVDERTALCITRSNNKVIIAATENTPITTTELANALSTSEKKGGLGCYNALNLDGGSSTQLYAKIDNFSLNVPNFNTVTDAVVVTKN